MNSIIKLTGPVFFKQGFTPNRLNSTSRVVVWEKPLKDKTTISIRCALNKNETTLKCTSKLVYNFFNTKRVILKGTSLEKLVDSTFTLNDYEILTIKLFTLIAKSKANAIFLTNALNGIETNPPNKSFYPLDHLRFALSEGLFTWKLVYIKGYLMAYNHFDNFDVILRGYDDLFIQHNKLDNMMLCVTLRVFTTNRWPLLKHFPAFIKYISSAEAFQSLFVKNKNALPKNFRRMPFYCYTVNESLECAQNTFEFMSVVMQAL